MKLKPKVQKMSDTPLALVVVENMMVMFSRVDKKTTSSLALSWSRDGMNFERDSKKVKIEIKSKTYKLSKLKKINKEDIKKCKDFSLSRTPNGFVMTYVRSGRKKIDDRLVIARSKDLYQWSIKSELYTLDERHTTICYDKKKDEFHMYRDGLFIKNQSSSTLTIWREKPSLVFTSRHEHFDEGSISIIGSIVTREGILLVYDASLKRQSHILLQAGAVLFDINDPKRIIWRSGEPIWQAMIETKNKMTEIHPLGFVSIENNFFIYWITSDRDIILAKIPALFKEIEEAIYHPKIFKKFKNNPIIEPREEHDWEGEGTFNPAVVEDDGLVHLLYRAIGRDGISRIGYAKSKNGTHFGKRSSVPVYEPQNGFGMPQIEKVCGPIGYNPTFYTSGGGWGGAEDPRTVKIDGRVYMTYVAFEGWNSVRIALTSISLDDFKHGRWIWKKPKLISPPNQVHKNWLLFPEKIHGKYAVLHGIAPKILIDYVPDINNFEGYIESQRPEGPQPGRIGYWDSFLRGAGPPPIKTKLGWLVLYHALDKRDYGKYKLGAMILDKNNPSKVLYRSMHPILTPDMHYENNGKPGVVYASGAVVRGDDLYVYYGGADKVCCVATTPIDKFLKYLKTGNHDHYELKKVSV